jgi:uroporphyrinogen decarboxylase
MIQFTAAQEDCAVAPPKNDLFLKALNGEQVTRPPVWMMRQAGRYLPQYMELKRKYDFFTRVQNPEMVCQITLQPVDIIGVDAAIIFSDILVIPQALGMEVQMNEGTGPLLPSPIRYAEDLKRLAQPDVKDSLHYVMDAIHLTKKELNGRVPLIGFAGAPFTILCYMVEGKGSKTFDKAKAFCYQEPAAAHQLLQLITDTTIAYLIAQAKAGADVVQVFDSWSGLLSPQDFEIWALPYLLQIQKAVQLYCPVILYPKGSWYAIDVLAKSGATAIGLDWCVPPAYARQMAGKDVTLQGNFDPAKLLLPVKEIQKETRHMIEQFGVHRYIANLGHGITPTIPVDSARAFVDAVKEYQA